MGFGFSNNMILGGLLYGKLAILLHVLAGDEPGPRFVFNVGLSITGIAVGIISKFVTRRREGK